MDRQSFLFLSLCAVVAFGASFLVSKVAESFTNDIFISIAPKTENTSKKDIKIKTPGTLSKIESPVFVSGEASPGWFFEGSFNIKIFSSSGALLGSGPVVATEDWISLKSVPFQGSIPFFNNTNDNLGFIVFEEGSSSGDEKVSSIKIPIEFEISGKNISSDKCHISGCSSQLCSADEGTYSTCEWKEEYACYRNALCERQSNGECSWTQTEELKNCLLNAREI